jgi:tetratricopeptide (TPR) repeat protein
MMIPPGARLDPPAAVAEFVWPLSLPGGEVAGAGLVRELPAQLMLPVWHTLRSVLLWAQVPPSGREGLFEEGAMAAWEMELLQGPLEDGVRNPLAVLARELAEPGADSPQRIAWACLCVTEWALDGRFEATALAFAEGAALAWPEHPRYAWTAGRLLRTHGRPREAEAWLRRAVRLAVRAGDWETQVVGLNSLGNVHHETGNNPEALRTLRAGLRAARRHRLRAREGEILHDLLVVSVWGGDLDEAERYAEEAYAIYRNGQHRLAALAHDVSFLWLVRGHHAHALAVMRELLPLFDTPEERIRVLGSAVRAAGACGEVALFDAFWQEAETLFADPWVLLHAAGPLLEMGYGAATLRRWEAAEGVLLRAIERAERRREADTQVRAENALAAVRLRQVPEPARSSVDARVTPSSDKLVRGFLRTLNAREHPAVCG